MSELEITNREESTEQPEGGEQEQQQPKQESLYDKRFAALARQQKALLEEKQGWKKEQTSLREQIRKEIEEEYKKKLQEDPFSTLDQFGTSYDKLTDLALGNQPKQLTESEKIAELEKKYEQSLRMFEEYKEQQQQTEKQKAIDAAVDQYRTNIANEVTSDLEKYELINHFNAQELVLETAIAYHQETGEVPKVEDIARYTEDYLLEQAQNNAGQLSKLRKLKVESPLSDSEREDATESFSKATAPTTLTNEIVAGSSKSPRNYYEDVEKSKLAAAELLKWND